MCRSATASFGTSLPETSGPRGCRHSLQEDDVLAACIGPDRSQRCDYAANVITRRGFVRDLDDEGNNHLTRSFGGLRRHPQGREITGQADPGSGTLGLLPAADRPKPPPDVSIASVA